MKKEIIKTTERDSNIELLRIVLMFMIILYHLVAHGIGLRALSKDTYITTPEDPIFISLLSLSCIAVNCFMFISGYYGIKFKIKTLLSLLIQAIFYSSTIYIFSVIFLGNSFSPLSFIKSLFPITYFSWWFLNAYIGVYIFSPFIEKALNKLSKLKFAGLILILIYLEATFLIIGLNFYSGDGLNVYTMLVVYLIACYFRLYIPHFKKPMIIYLVCSLLIFIFINIFIKLDFQSIGWRITVYNSPIVIIGAIAFFYIFKNIKIKNNYINRISPLMLGIYLIHDHTNIRYFWFSNIISNFNKEYSGSYTIIIILLINALIIFTIGCFIEQVRLIICTPLVNKIYNKIVNPTIRKISLLLNKQQP